MVTSATEHIASAVRDAMATQGVSQVALSEATGIARMTLVRRLSGHSPFNTDELQRVCEHLRLDAAGLLAMAAA